MLIAIVIMPLSSCSAHNIENKVKGLALSLATAYKQTNEKNPSNQQAEIAEKTTKQDMRKEKDLQRQRNQQQSPKPQRSHTDRG